MSHVEKFWTWTKFRVYSTNQIIKKNKMNKTLVVLIVLVYYLCLTIYDVFGTCRFYNPPNCGKGWCLLGHCSTFYDSNYDISICRCGLFTPKETSTTPPWIYKVTYIDFHLWSINQINKDILVLFDLIGYWWRIFDFQ